MTTANLARYLTTAQALADLADFTAWLRDNLTDHSSNSSETPPAWVIVVGGPYAGTLSSYFRQTYPHLANWSWSSSPPLKVKANFSEYDEHCAEVLNNRSIGATANCYNNTLGIVDYFENAVTNATFFEEARQQLGLKESNDSVSLQSMIADQIAGMIQYMMNDGGAQLDQYCTNQSGPDPNITSFVAWFNATNDDPDAGDPLLYTASGRYPDSRAWTWQTCNEFGWFQTASGLLRSRYVNLSYYERVCQTLFGVSIPDQSDVAVRYGGATPQTDNIIFVNGKIDPWSTLSVQWHDNDNEANHAFNRRSFFIENGSHCSELSAVTPSTGVEEVRKTVLDTLAGWTSCDCIDGSHGFCEYGLCICKDKYGGKDCSIKQVDSIVFRIAAAALVLLPALMMVVIGCTAWFLFLQEVTEQKEYGGVP
jgi:serine protease 16